MRPEPFELAALYSHSTLSSGGLHHGQRIGNKIKGGLADDEDLQTETIAPTSARPKDINVHRPQLKNTTSYKLLTTVAPVSLRERQRLRGRETERMRDTEFKCGQNI
jgi:hypothetical protein